jgi:hypothetical protein
MRRITEKPEHWVVLRIENDTDAYYKVFAGWRGGYLDSDRWKMNSGIAKIEEDEDYYYFYGASGSCYQCHKKGYALKEGMYHFSSYAQGVLETVMKNSPISIEILDQGTDFMNLLEQPVR